MQMKRYSKITERTRNDSNEIKIIREICFIGLYNLIGERIATAKFNKKHLDRVKKYKWFLSARGSVEAHINGKIKKMHRFLSVVSKSKVIDHIDRDPLNNLDSNLRVVTQQQNIINNNGKNYSYSKRLNKYEVYINYNGGRKRLGYFDTEKKAKEVAQKARKDRYKKVFGEIETFVR